MDDFWKFLIVVVAVVAACIVFQQFWLARDRLKLDLFEKRFAVFSAARLFLSKVRQHRGVLMDDFGEYRSSIDAASFLFNEDVVDFLSEIDSRALHLWDLQGERNGRPAGPERGSFAARITPELDWFLAQLSMLNPTFGPYMKVEEWHWISLAQY